MIDIPTLEVQAHVWFAVFYLGMIGLAVLVLDTWHLVQRDADPTPEPDEHEA